MFKTLKNYFRLGVLLFSISFMLWNCQRQEIISEQQKTIETVSIEEAQNFFGTSEFSKNSKSKNEQYIIPIIDIISQEGITDSEELLTIIPARVNNQSIYSRILLLKIDGVIEKVVFNLIPDDVENKNEFSGKIYIADIEGNFISGYRVENNVLISQFKESNSVQSKNTYSSKSSSGDGCSECPFSDCELCGDLEEVVINASGSGPSTINYIPLEILYLNGGGGSITNTWNPISGGGSTGSTACSKGYVKDSNGNCVIVSCGEGYVKDGNGNCVINPLFGADCRSFEYAQPPGALQKACAVTNLGNNFYYSFFRADGSWEAGYFPTNIPLIYFTMPTFMTNGQAANLTALAVTSATLATDAYVLANAKNLSEQDVRDQFTINLKTAMGVYGGTIQKTAPFGIPSPAPYLSSFFGPKTDCN